MTTSKPVIDSSGMRHGRITVLRPIEYRPGGFIYECLCDCGKIFEGNINNLRRGSARSCGCLRYENKTNLKHGLYKSREYKIWKGIKNRCFNKNEPKYHLYGGRGITLDKRWHDFPTFLKDMGKRPSPRHSIDRINNDGPYSKENCRWADQKMQCNNRRTTRFISFNGKTKTAEEWGKAIGVSAAGIRARLKYMPLERALMEEKIKPRITREVRAAQLAYARNPKRKAP